MWSWGKTQFPLCKKKNSHHLLLEHPVACLFLVLHIQLHIQQVVLLLDVALASVSILTSPEGE